MSRVSSSNSHLREAALKSIRTGAGASQMGNTLSIAGDLYSGKSRSPPPDDVDNRSSRSSKKSVKKRSRSRSKSGDRRSRSKSRSRSPKRPRVDPTATANVCMVKLSSAREIRDWVKQGIESKQEAITLRSSYKPAFEGDFELMAPELDKSMIRKWLRNIGDTSDKPKLKDFWEKQLVTLQRELKDVFEPLIYLLNSVPAGNHAEMPLVVANRLLGHVFAHMTQMRRTNVMRHVAPKFSNMVDDPMLFSSRDHRHLFGERFITALDKEADLDAKMDKI